MTDRNTLENAKDHAYFMAELPGGRRHLQPNIFSLILRASLGTCLFDGPFDSRLATSHHKLTQSYAALTGRYVLRIIMDFYGRVNMDAMREAVDAVGKVF